MSKSNVRLTEKDNKLIDVVKKKMEKSGFINPTTADAVRHALWIATK